MTQLNLINFKTFFLYESGLIAIREVSQPFDEDQQYWTPYQTKHSPIYGPARAGPARSSWTGPGFNDILRAGHAAGPGPGPGPQNSMCGPGPGPGLHNSCGPGPGLGLKSYLRAGPGPKSNFRFLRL